VDESRPPAFGRVNGLLLVGVSTVASILVLELLLRMFLPFNIASIGHRHSPNAERYGWGFAPGEMIRLRDPDTDAIYIDRANNHGWRDADRSYDDASGAYRILALGDSNTFGVLVPATQTWTVLLERKLRERGYHVEVINMAYAGWGTDQEYEAFRLEGYRYAPDLVVLQFTSNDLLDNRRQGKASDLPKPFFYELDASGSPRRRATAVADPETSWRDRAHGVISSSELLKRAYVTYEVYRWRTRPSHFVSDARLAHIALAEGLDRNAPLLDALAPFAGREVSGDRLETVVRRFVSGDAGERILRMLEHHPFQEFWFPVQWQPAIPDTASPEWQLFFALLRAIRAQAESIGASLAVISDQERGLYEWERYWQRIAPDEAARQRYLAPTDVLHDFAARERIGVIANTRVHQRARNDSHPNVDGNVAMAENVLSYLMETQRDALERHVVRR